MWCPQNVGTQGNPGWLLSNAAAVDKHLSPFYRQRRITASAALRGVVSPVQPCAEHLLTAKAMLGVSGVMVWVLLWVSPTLGAHNLVEPLPDSICFTILLDVNCVFSHGSLDGTIQSTALLA